MVAVLFYTPFSGLMASSLAFISPTPPPPGTITSEVLAPPSIPIAEGSNVITAGVGLFGDPRVPQPPEDLEPGNIEFSVPQEAAIQQVLLYWVGREGDPNSGVEPESPPDQTTILVNNTEVTGDKFAEVLLEGPDDIVVAYRADITDMGLVSQGQNTLAISGDPFVNYLHDGAGVVVITDGDDDQAHVEIRDGIDAAYINASTPEQQVTVPQTFTFSSAEFDREAELTVFVSQVAERVPDGLDTFRTSNVIVDVGGSVLEFPNQLQSNNGLDWDTLTLPITIPAGAESLTVHLESGAVAPIPTTGFSNSAPAAFQWIAAILAVTEEEADDDTGGGDGDSDGGGDDGGDGGGGSDDGDGGGDGNGDGDGDGGDGGGDDGDGDGGDGDGDGDGDDGNGDGDGGDGDGDGGDDDTATTTPPDIPDDEEDGNATTTAFTL